MQRTITFEINKLAYVDFLSYWNSPARPNKDQYGPLLACAASELNPGILYRGLVRMRRRLGLYMISTTIQINDITIYSVLVER